LARWNNLEDMWTAVEAKQISKSWSCMAEIYEDIWIKKPDLFVWIICSRDLSNVKPEALQRICMSREQCKYNDNHPYNSDCEFLTVADSYLERLRAKRPFSVLKEAIKTNGDFPSTYHFIICEFSKSHG